MNTDIVSTVQEKVGDAVGEGVSVLKGETGAISGAPLANFHFVTGLATVPRALLRQAFGLVAHLVVPPGTVAVTHLPGGERRIYQPGSYTLVGMQPGAALVQWIDMRRRQMTIGPVEGWSRDKWRVRLWLAVDVEVSDPLKIAAHREPLTALVSAVRNGALCCIEQHTHAALTGAPGDQGGIDAPAAIILERLRNDPALDGLAIINVRVIERQGDERQIEAATAATVAAAQIDEELRVAAARHRAHLQEIEAAAALAAREHNIRLASAAAAAREKLLTQQAEVQQATLAARLQVVMAQIQAQVSEIAREEQLWQAEQMRLQAEWERVQQQLLEAHHTDQQLRLMEGQQGMLRAEGELALAAEEKRNAHALALAEIQQQLAEQRAAQAQAQAERRAAHERDLLELHLRYEQMVAEQMQRLEQWRTEHIQIGVQQKRQHERQMAAIAGTAQIAAAAAAAVVSATGNKSGANPGEVADAGLRALQEFVEA
ncbi:hypothetical protein [Roseiflexus sp.]|uniref:hypothetical protein n=1 Tax=Roseiflexus sp. TaxID=2562120 RepID=UPI0021DD0CDD|nr:hypothetical protein [Roseiflexus sp.]GIW01730.1 MAG: hypothetical protein KatS3mg058_3133 [Roseiflexus sp.]